MTTTRRANPPDVPATHFRLPDILEKHPDDMTGVGVAERTEAKPAYSPAPSSCAGLPAAYDDSSISAGRTRICWATL